MLQIDGVIRLVPVKVTADAGTIKIDDKNEESAVVQTLFTANGPCQIIYPVDSITGVIEVLQKAKKEAENNKSKSIYIPPGGLSEADALAKAENEIRDSDK